MRTGFALLTCLTLAGALPAAHATPATPATPANTLPRELTLDRIFAVDNSGRRPSLLTWSPDGRRLAWLWGGGESAELRALDPETGQEEVLMRPAQVGASGGGGRKGIAIGSLAWTPSRDALLLTADGDLQLWSLQSHSLRRLTSSPEEEEDGVQLAPDGRRAAFNRGSDLYVVDLATGRERALTHDGRDNEILNGVDDWLYEEEIWDRYPVGFWWSPDSRHIAFLHFEEDGVPVHPLLERTARPPQVHWQRYPTPGDPNPKVKVGVVDVESGAVSWLDTGKEDVYLVRVAWTPKSDAVAVQRLTRDQKRLDLLRCETTGGSCRTISTDAWPTWVNVASDFRYLEDGRFVQGSEKSGWRRLYLHGAGGEEIRAVTPAGWAVTGLDGIVRDGEGRSWAIVTAFSIQGLGPIERQVFRAGLDREAWEPLTSTPGTHDAIVAPGTGFWIHTWSDAETPQRAEVRTADRTFPLPYEPPSGYDPAGLPKWKFLTIPGPDGTRLPARMLEPTGFDAADSARKYPAIVYHYGGPGSQVVTNRWDLRWRDLWHKRMAQRGFVVLSVDSLSSTFFGKQGEDRDHLHLGPTDLAAQLAAVDYLKSLGWVDTGRIGLWGWSGGGSATLYCLLHRPGVWKAGVAGAPVTDWRLYDTSWAERYMGLPGDNPDGYRESSALAHAADLRDKLLIVHGLADDNVHPENTIEMIGRLVAAQRPFEDALYPGQRHSYRPDAMRHFFARMEEFFERELRADMSPTHGDVSGTESQVSSP
jgi:dipeptidyl-peptidase-4